MMIRYGKCPFPEIHIPFLFTSYCNVYDFVHFILTPIVYDLAEFPLGW